MTLQNLITALKHFFTKAQEIFNNNNRIVIAEPMNCAHLKLNQAYQTYTNSRRSRDMAHRLTEVSNTIIH